MNQIPKNEWQKKERMFKVDENRRSMLSVRVFFGVSLIDEFLAEDIIDKDDYYLAIKNGKNFSLIPKTYYIRVTEKEF